MDGASEPDPRIRDVPELYAGQRGFHLSMVRDQVAASLFVAVHAAAAAHDAAVKADDTGLRANLENLCRATSAARDGWRDMRETYKDLRRLADLHLEGR